MIDRTEGSTRRLSQQLCDEGEMLLRHQQVAEALKTLARAIDIDGQNSKAWLWQALALTDVARFDEALASYDQAVRIDPEDYGAWNSRGALLLELGRASEALSNFDWALRMPFPPAVVKAVFLLNKGKALYMLGCYAQAYDVLRQASELDPTPESLSGVEACREMLCRNAIETSGR